MTKTLTTEKLEGIQTGDALAFWPASVRNNPRREMDLPRLVVPMFGPVGNAYVEDPDGAYGTAD